MCGLKVVDSLPYVCDVATIRSCEIVNLTYASTQNTRSDWVIYGLCGNAAKRTVPLTSLMLVKVLAYSSPDTAEAPHFDSWGTSFF